MTLSAVRALFARCLLGSSTLGEAASLGSILLRPHQQSAVARLRFALAEFGGALLSDQVGMGKTFVALAIARGIPNVRVVAPAVLRDMWRDAAAAATQGIDFISTESLSRRLSSPTTKRGEARPDFLIIVDEAHHFRNPATRRYAALSRLVQRSNVLFLSATPVHNRTRDLSALLSIFMGSRAAELTPSELSQLVIRRNRDRLGEGESIPEVVTPRWCDLRHDDGMPELLLSLPPPLPPRGGGDGGALIVHSLIRQWVSSDAALRGALVRRLQRATALTEALESGAYPSKGELSAWTSAEDCVQLAFAELIAPRSDAAEGLLPTVRLHAEAIVTLARRLKGSGQNDNERADVIRELRRVHSDRAIVAFSQYADTVDGLFRILAPEGKVAALTGNGARVFGGRVSRAEAIGRFAPRASRRIAPARSDVVTLLLTTDLLSEGVNLQDAGVVIHLDLPWTPARMEQRLGRIARMGSMHSRVFSYIMRPPASAEALIRVERILHVKMQTAGLVTDGLQRLLPDSSSVFHGDRSTPGTIESVRSLLHSWTAKLETIPGSQCPSELCDENLSEPVAASVCASVEGFLALCRNGSRYSLTACDERGLSDDPVRALALLRLSDGLELPTRLFDVDSATTKLYRHFAGSRVLSAPQRQGSAQAAPRRIALRRIALIANRSRPHERSRIASLASSAKKKILGRLGSEDERRLVSLSSKSLSDEDWLSAVSELGLDAATTADHFEIVAVIVFRNDYVRKA